MWKKGLTQYEQHGTLLLQKHNYGIDIKFLIFIMLFEELFFKTSWNNYTYEYIHIKIKKIIEKTWLLG